MAFADMIPAITMTNAARLISSRHFLGYQSKGKSPGTWLKPEIDQLLPELIDNGLKKIILIPLSFAMNHLETLYDLDQEIILAITNRQQVDLARVTMCNDDDDFISMLFNNILSYIQYLTPERH